MHNPENTKLTSKEIRNIILRTLKLNDQADKGYTARIVLCEILSLADEYLFILLISSVTNGIAEGNNLQKLLFSTAVTVGICLAVQIAVKLIKRRECCHKAKHDMQLRKIMNEKISDRIKLEDIELLEEKYI